MKATILIVDDVPTNLQVLVRLLSDTGYRILVAEDGMTALDQITREKPDLILLDVTMPGLDGFETCRRIKADPAMRDTPVLFLTARSEISDKLEGFDVGGVDYLTKPVQREEIIARVNAHLTILQQRRQLQSMLEQRQRFMRIAAHDLRNLLTVINGYSQIGLASQTAERKEQAFGRIRDACNNMQDIISDFLALQLLGSGSDGQLDVFDLQRVISEVVEQSSFSAKAKGITLTKQTSAEDLPTRGNMAHTHQILTNYLSNALKYSPPNTHTQVVALSSKQAWRVEVRDEGPGIPPEERSQLFVEFARISNKPTGKETSTGLGLSIVKALAEAQGGAAGAEFPDGGGSVFWFEVPMVEVKAPA